MLCCWVEDPNSEAFKLHLPRIYDYLWIAEDGMKVQVNIHVNLFDFNCTYSAMTRNQINITTVVLL